MASAKDIRVAPIKAADANNIIKQLHYSGKVVQNSTIHLGVFLDGKIEGAMQFGSPMDRRKMQPLVEGSGWNGFIELNRMAFSERLPRNSESRAIAICMRLLRRTYQNLEWVLTFADGTQCGDGTIYRASGFVLTGIKVSKDLWLCPDGEVRHSMNFKTARPTPIQRQVRSQLGMATETENKLLALWGARLLPGFQLRYIYFLNPSARERLTVPILPFSRIAEMGASMYRGERTRPKQATPATSGEAAGQNRPGRSNIPTAGTDEPA
jgi:hypothetical protein